jgi:chromosomal replication initiator protein
LTLNSGLFSFPLLPAVELERPALRAKQASREVAKNGSPEHFIAGPENAVVRSLAEAAADDPLPYNPIVLCGGSGVGKTSLAHALAARRRDALGLKSLVATSGTDLARALAHAIETDSVADLRTRHQRCDILLIDDLQRLATKPAAQQFLLAALDVLLRRGALVIATMRQLPQLTAGLDPALSSRLTSGLVARVAPPGPLARRELVRHFAATVELPLPDSLVAQLAGRDGDVRHRFTTAPKLRQAVLQLALSSKSQLRPVRQSQVARLLSPKAPESKQVIRRTLAAVSRHYGVPVADLKGKSRQQAVSDARSMAMHLARRLTAASFAEIGRQFGTRDHSTVLHACKKMLKLLEDCDETRRLADELAMQIAADCDAA